jgi:putative transposase
LVFLDESGIEDNVTFNYGWSFEGDRCYDLKTYQHKRRISMISALCNKKLFAPLIFEGYCDSSIFEVYIKDVLIAELKEGMVVVMDNINFHHSEKVREIIENAGCKIIFLPTYSPDLNPIEHQWFKIKNQIRKTTHQFNDFFEAVSYVLNCVTN